MSQPSKFSPLLISRRTALKLIGVGAVGGALGYSRFSKPQPVVFQEDKLNLPNRLNHQKKVVVVGAGLAGLAAAYQLSQRGFAVTLLEKSPNLGGKIASWKIKVGDEEFLTEHGFHGFFPQYYNLKSLVSELNITNNFQSLEFYSLVFRNNDLYNPEVFRPSSSAFPWNIVDLAISSPNRFDWGINLTKLAHWEVFKAISGFGIPKSFDRFDNISVADWVKQDFPQGLYDLYFLPFAKSSLNAPDLLSTGELLQFFHFYFFGNPEGLAFNGTTDDMGTSLVQPIAKAIEANGGKIITQATVTKIDCKGNEIASLSYHQGDDLISVPFWVDRNSLLSNDTEVYYGAGDRVYFANAKSEEAVSLTCTHQGCSVQKQANGEFLCPCHGSSFDKDGKLLQGPATRDLPRYQITQTRNDAVELAAIQTDTTEPATEITADYYVIATDVPGVKQLFNLINGEIDNNIKDKVDRLAIADPFAVGRFWFDRDFDWEHSNFASLSGYSLTDSITLYHRIQTQFVAWSQRTGGSVVELHAYCYKEKEFPTQEALLTTFERELYEIVPELKDATMLHKELVNQKNFSGYPPGSYCDRPETNSEIANLVFAGDWVKMPFPCGLMERAVSSGLLAANTILQEEGLQRRQILSVMPEGVFKI